MRQKAESSQLNLRILSNDISAKVCTLEYTDTWQTVYILI